MNEPATVPRIRAYFSHSYRAADRDINLYFWHLFHEKGFSFTVDPKSDTFSASYLEYLMKRSACFAAVIPRRADQAPYFCSPFMVFEYGLAVQARRPRLVFVERDIGGGLFRKDDPDVVVFDRATLEDDQAEYESRITRLAERARPDRTLDRTTLGSVGLLLSPTSVDPVTLAQRLTTALKGWGYHAVEPIDPRFDRLYELAIHLDQYDFVVVDVAAVSPTGMEWLHGYLSGRFIPSIRLFRLDGESPHAVSPPPWALSQTVVGGQSEDAVLFWRSDDELLSKLERIVQRFTRVRTDLRWKLDAERYFRSAGRSTSARVFISNAQSANAFAVALSSQLELENIRYFHYKANNTLPLAERWQEELAREIRGSRIFVQLFSRDYMSSRYCAEELATAQRAESEGMLKILPLFLDPPQQVEVPTQGRLLNELPEDKRIPAAVESIDALLRREAEEETKMTTDRAHVTDIAILAITQDEYAAVLKLLPAPKLYQGGVDEPNLHAWVTSELPSPDPTRPYQVVLALTHRQGNVASSQATLYTVERWRPRYVVMVGIAGGFPKEGVRRGSVAISSVIWGYEYGKIADGKFNPRNDQTFQVDNALVTAAITHNLMHPDWHRRIAVKPPDRASVPNVVVGPIASGEQVVDDARYPLVKAALEHWPKLIAIEMEGAGGAAAIAKLHERGVQVGFVMVRGISDMPLVGEIEAGGNATATGEAQSEERQNWTPYAASAAAAFAVTLIESGWPTTPRG
jgi:nucleoside phosphorylase